jgi:hypothetical protein
MRVSFTARYNASQSRQDGAFRTTLGEFGSVSIGNVSKMAVGLSAEERVNLGSGFFGKVGAGVGFDSQRGKLENLSIGGGYENNYFAISMAKNMQFFNDMGNQEITSFGINGRIKGEMLDFVTGLGLNEDKKLTSVSVAIEKNKNFFAKKLKEIYDSINDDDALQKINEKRRKFGQPPINKSSLLLVQEKMSMAGAILADSLEGGLQTIGLKGDMSGIGLILGIITDTKVFQVVTGVNPRIFSRMEEFLFKNQGKLNKNDKENFRLYKSLNLDTDFQSEYAKSKGRYDLFPTKIANQLIGSSVASSNIIRKVVIHGEKNVDIYSDGTFKFKEGIYPHVPQITQRTMADGTLQIEINFGNDAVRANLGSTQEHVGILGPTGRIENIKARFLTEQEKNENKQILQCLKDSKVISQHDNYEMQGLTNDKMIIQKVVDKIVNTKVETTPEYFKQLIIPNNEVIQVMKGIQTLKNNILELNNTKQISQDLEQYMSNNMNTVLDQSINTYVKNELQNKFNTYGIYVPKSIENKPLLIYQAIVRARMQEMNRYDNGRGRYKETFEKNLPKDLEVYKEYHALIVEHCKRFCRKKPLCDNCPIRTFCKLLSR